MDIPRSVIDRRSNQNRRQLNIDYKKPERRKSNRRVSGERRDGWSSIDSSWIKGAFDRR